MCSYLLFGTGLVTESEHTQSNIHQNLAIVPMKSTAQSQGTIQMVRMVYATVLS